MSLLRTVMSALCILAGAFLIASWAVSSVIVEAVEDGTALRGITERALDSPEVRSALAEHMTDRAIGSLSESGFDASVPVVRGAVESGFEAVVSTDAFRDSVLAEVDDAHGQFAEQLTGSLREPAPLVLDVDVSDTVNARLDEVPGVGTSLPEVTVAPISVEVLSADTFTIVRDTYQQIEWASTWGLWAGIGLLIAGLLVSQRRRWFVAKVLLAVGVICLLLGGAIAVLGPETIVTFIPGGTEGPLSTIWRDILTEETAPLVMTRSLWAAVIAFVGALLATLVGAVLGGRRR